MNRWDKTGLCLLVFAVVATVGLNFLGGEPDPNIPFYSSGPAVILVTEDDPTIEYYDDGSMDCWVTDANIPFYSSGPAVILVTEEDTTIDNWDNGSESIGNWGKSAYRMICCDPNAIRRLGEEGHICAVFGHQWRGGRPGEGVSEDGGWGSTYLDYHPSTNYRTCQICGKCQEQNLEWK